jgi:hypothetical protein
MDREFVSRACLSEAILDWRRSLPGSWKRAKVEKGVPTKLIYQATKTWRGLPAELFRRATRTGVERSQKNRRSRFATPERSSHGSERQR